MNSESEAASVGLLPAGLSARRPTESDHPRVLAVMGRWWGGLGGDDGARQRAALVPRLFFQHFTVGSTVVEDADQELAAFLVGFVSPSRPEVGYIHFVGVDPGIRGRGLGRTLYRRFFAYAAAHGATTVACITGPANRASIAFHTRLGFTIQPGDKLVDGVDTHSDYDGPGLDRVTFARRLP